MSNSHDTMLIEDTCLAPFADKLPVSIDKGEGVHVWDEEGKHYLDFTAGWGVTSIGHASPVITAALWEQSCKIIQNPDSGLTYSPARARLLTLMREILPVNLSRVFFTNSGAEANDAAIKLARKASGRQIVISTNQSFHGRTISTISATGQDVHLKRFNPLMPGYVFVPFGDADALEKELTDDVAAFIIEPIQGEGGVNVPAPGYLAQVSELCRKHGTYFIADEIQTGFFRTGPVFFTSDPAVRVDFLTMAKGIAGGFPFGAFAMTEEIAGLLAKGDHGGTYCGNPLGCAVATAVIRHLLDHDTRQHVEELSAYTFDTLNRWRAEFPLEILDARGQGLLIALELSNPELAGRVNALCRANGLLLNLKHGTVFRIFPALTIKLRELDEGLTIFKSALDTCIG